MDEYICGTRWTPFLSIPCDILFVDFKISPRQPLATLKHRVSVTSRKGKKNGVSRGQKYVHKTVSYEFCSAITPAFFVGNGHDDKDSFVVRLGQCCYVLGSSFEGCRSVGYDRSPVASNDQERREMFKRVSVVIKLTAAERWGRARTSTGTPIPP